MKLIKVLSQTSIKACMYAQRTLPLLTIGFTLASLMSGDAFAGGTNHLSGLKEDVVATFGAGSDMQYFLLLAEGIGGAYAYTKTKNIAVLAGVPLLMVFTHWALK
jgi:type IV conjugative transfer system pilin TraA